MLEEDKEFDLKIRSILEDGREEVPDYLWEAVQKRLPAKNKRPVVIWLRRSAIAVAAAAAAASVFFVGSDIFNSSRHHSMQQPYMSADAGIQVVDKAAPAEDTLSSDKAILADAGSGIHAASGTPAHPAVSSRRPQALMDETMQQSATQEATATSAAMEAISQSAATKLHADREASGHSAAEESTETVGTAAEATAATEEHGKITGAEESAGMDRRSGDGQSSSMANWDETQILDADIDAARRKSPVAITVSGNAISNSTQGKSASSIAPMQSSGIPPANSLHEDMATSYGIPLSFGAGVKVFFNSRWALGAGIDYSLLNRTLSGIYYDENSTPFSDSDILNSQSYIGIPVNVYFSILKKDFIDLYAYAGGAVEKCVSSTYLIDAPGQTLTYREKSRGVQMSADLGIGVEFLVMDRLGIYIDPSIRYYFKSRQPKSIRTVQPLMIGFEAGLRVRL